MNRSGHIATTALLGVLLGIGSTRAATITDSAPTLTAEAESLCSVGVLSRGLTHLDSVVFHWSFINEREVHSRKVVGILPGASVSVLIDDPRIFTVWRNWWCDGKASCDGVHTLVNAANTGVGDPPNTTLYMLYDLQGRVRLAGNGYNSLVAIARTTLPAGLYFVRAAGQHTSKLLRIR